jgi:DNA-directed RNA polymerase I subunit RPA2
LKTSFAKISMDVGKKMEYFLATGNLISNTGLDLQQTSGYTIVAEKLNFYRYISHFRSVHRGSFFAELKTTTVRKLLPEAWGFLCPVHTPDGTPCGLLNHLSHVCTIVTKQLDVSKLPSLIASYSGVSQMIAMPKKNSGAFMTIQLDGRVIGWCSAEVAKHIALDLRRRKVAGDPIVSSLFNPRRFLSTWKSAMSLLQTRANTPGCFSFQLLLE